MTAMEKLNVKSKTATTSELSDQIETLRNELSALTDVIADLAKSKGDEALFKARAHASDAREKAVDSAETARLQAMELQDQANDFVKNQPATALGIAAGVGFLIGMMGARR